MENFEEIISQWFERKKPEVILDKGGNNHQAWVMKKECKRKHTSWVYDFETKKFLNKPKREQVSEDE